MTGFGILWFGLLAFVVILLAKALVPEGSSPATAGDRPEAIDSSLAIAEGRYARGEIGKEEFEAIRRGLA